MLLVIVHMLATRDMIYISGLQSEKDGCDLFGFEYNFMVSRHAKEQTKLGIRKAKD